MAAAMHDQLQSFGLLTGMADKDQQDSRTRLDFSWKEFFRDPSKWWDNRRSKRSPKQPDFKHKLTTQPLWMHSRHNPPWVKDQLIIHGYEVEQCMGMANAADPFPLSLIRACCKNKDLSRGTMIHHELQKRGLLDKKYSDALITMYAKCGELQKAQGLLDMHNSRNIIAWTALISSYTRQGQGQNALKCFERMQHEGIPPDAVTYVCILKACAVTGAIDKGKEIHDAISRQGMLEHSIELGGALVDMYAKCGALSQARNALEMLPSRDVVSWNALIAGYAQNGQGQQALERFEQMRREGIPPDAVTYVCILKACAVIGAINKGKQTHDEILEQGLLEHNVVLGGALVDMYAKCGALLQAQGVLEKLPSHDVVSWNALISGYAQKGHGHKALECFERMKLEGISPNIVTYLGILKSCAVIGAIDRGKQFHDEILRQGLLEHSIVLGGALVDMYAKCGALSQAHGVLEKLPSRDTISWNALIAGYAQKGQGEKILECFKQLQSEGILPDAVTYVGILKACALTGSIDSGKQIHNEISRQGLLEHSVELGNALVDMYAKCGALPQARSVLEKLPSRNVVSWNALMAGYTQKGQGQQALECCEEMEREGIAPNVVTYVCIINACALIRGIDKGKKIHDEISRQGLLEHSIELGGALVDMYAKCGALAQARSVLEKLPIRDVISWNALIAGYSQEGQGEQALKSFEKMQSEGILPSAVTYVCILKACAAIGAIDKGNQIHDEILRQGLLEHSIVLGGALVDMYAKCGVLSQAQGVLEKLPFRDVISWNALIAGYAQKGQGQQTLECFEQMQHDGILPNAVTYVCILKACAVIGAIDKGKQIHDEISRQGLLEHSIVLGGALVDMYAKCGALPQAQSVLENLPSHDVVSWNALITGYAQKGQGQQALECFKQMQHEGIPPDAVTYMCILKACALVGAIDKGKQIHNKILRQGLLEHSIELGNALVDMYAKCGALALAQSFLEKLPSRNVVSWNALITGYAQKGQGEQAMNCFKQMQHEGILPDLVTFICLLNLCNHLGLVEKGQELFDNMGVMYGLEPDVECFTCMVDLLGRAGHLVKAAEVIQEMPFSANSGIWLCLLGACRKWVDVNVGTWAFEQVVKIDKCDGSAYVLMASIYAAARMPERAKDIEVMRLKNKA